MNYLIPNYVVRANGDKPSLIVEMLLEKVIKENDADKVLMLFKYLFENTTQSGTVNFTLEDIILECGFTPQAGKGRVNNKFKDILVYLNSKGFFGCNDIDFASIKLKQFIRIPVDYFEKGVNGNKARYFMLSSEEVDSISDIENVDNNKLLLYFSTLKSRIYNSVDSLDTKAQVCYASASTMASDILLSEDTITDYNHILEENDLIYIGNAGKYSKMEGSKRIYRQSNNTYTLTSIDYYEQEVENAIDIYDKYMEGFGWTKCKESSMTNRQAAGTINKLNHLKSIDKISNKDKARLEDLQEQQSNSDNIKWDNKELLDKCEEDLLLSEIYYNLGISRLSEKYQAIECKLGLIGDNGELSVDYDYYKWVITEYNSIEHNYFYNMVAKRVRENY